MKYLLTFVLAMMAAMTFSVFAQDTDYPGQLPDWDTRHTVACSMTQNDSNVKNYTFSHGNLDYVQAGMLMVFLQQGELEFYSAIKDAAENDTDGLDPRLVPDPAALLQDMVDIEKMLNSR